MNIPSMPFGKIMYVFLLALFLGVELLGQMVCIRSVLADTAE